MASNVITIETLLTYLRQKSAQNKLEKARLSIKTYVSCGVVQQKVADEALRLFEEENLSSAVDPAREDAAWCARSGKALPLELPVYLLNDGTENGVTECCKVTIITLQHSVDTLKAQIESRSGIQQDKQTLICHGATMKNGELLKHHAETLAGATQLQLEIRDPEEPTVETLLFYLRCKGVMKFMKYVTENKVRQELVDDALRHFKELVDDAITQRTDAGEERERNRA